jgi:hypothetical protein
VMLARIRHFLFVFNDEDAHCSAAILLYFSGACSGGKFVVLPDQELDKLSRNPGNCV